jgi:KaiC/GvpD/RAD55 family RecA-like ATPase
MTASIRRKPIGYNQQPLSVVEGGRRRAPHSIEAEQALLGAILFENGILDQIADFLLPEHFFDDLHREIYRSTRHLVDVGKRASPVTLAPFFQNAEPIDASLTVPQYLAQLLRDVPTIINAREYARTVHDLAIRRQLILIAEDVQNAAYDSPVDCDPAEQIREALARCESLGQHALTPLAPISLVDFLAMELPAREWIVDNLIRARSTSMIYAWRGVGKTWFALSLAYAIARGDAFLKWKANRSRSVLYVDGEMPAVEMQSRLDKLANGKIPEAFQFLSADLCERGIPDLSSAAGQSAIEHALGKADVLILDNISTLCRSGVENEAESWLPVQNWLLKLRRRGKTVILVHHAGKGREQRGTSKREDILDLVINLRSPDSHKTNDRAFFEVRLEKARGLIGEATAAIQVELTEGPHGEPLWGWKALAGKVEVLALKGEGKTVRQIAAELGLSKSAVQRKIEQQDPVSVPLSHPLKRGKWDSAGADQRKAGQPAGRREREKRKNAYAMAKAGELGAGQGAGQRPATNRGNTKPC